jgi:IS5 family transposase
MVGKQNSQLSLLDGAFFARKKRCRSDALLEQINAYVNWSTLAHRCVRVFKDSKRGRPTIPIEVSLKCLFLQFLYDLSDPALEDAIIDRLSFQRFLGVSFDEELPDFSTIWKFRERLVEHDVYDSLFDEILAGLDERGFVLRRGTIVDATIVQAARRQRKIIPDTSAPSEELPPRGDDPSTSDSPRKQAQRNRDATSTKKGKKYYYGYKGHIGTDQGSNIIRRKRYTTASVHDSQERENLMCGDERSQFGDKAYGSDDLKRDLRKKGVFYGILDKGKREHPLSPRQHHRNKQKSRVRCAVERPFAHMKRWCGYNRARYVNLKRNDLHFTFLCIIHNVRRGIALSACTP